MLPETFRTRIIAALGITFVGSLLLYGATHYPDVAHSNRPPECAREWFTDRMNTQRTEELEKLVTSRGNEPVLRFCLGIRKLFVIRQDGEADIHWAVTSGYAPAAEWLGMALFRGALYPQDFAKANGQFVFALAVDKNSQTARLMLYAFGVKGLRRDVCFGVAILLQILATATVFKRANGFDLRFLGPAVLGWSVFAVFKLKEDGFLALGGNLETFVVFVVAALGANLTAAAITHDPSHNY